jgi:hypothetical protein
MRTIPIIEVIVVNAVLVFLFTQVSGDLVFRNNYWAAMGFYPTTTLYPLSLVTSAVKGQTSIPGLLTVDWEQVIVVVLVFADLVYFWSWYSARRRSARAQSPAAPTSEEPAISK